MYKIVFFSFLLVVCGFLSTKSLGVSGWKGDMFAFSHSLDAHADESQIKKELDSRRNRETQARKEAQYWKDYNERKAKEKKERSDKEDAHIKEEKRRKDAEKKNFEEDKRTRCEKELKKMKALEKEAKEAYAYIMLKK